MEKGEKERSGKGRYSKRRNREWEKREKGNMKEGRKGGEKRKKGVNK